MGTPRSKPARASAFEALGLPATIDAITEEIAELYLSDNIPWVVGYSGGKDSTAVLQLVWRALQKIPAEKRTKTIHVISTDTLVENPVVSFWVTSSLKQMREAAPAQSVPIEAHQLTPALRDSFWVNLIGRGYPAPRHKFRWCTERLKIKPSNTFILEVVASHGEAILVLGTRKAESSVRAKRMTDLEKQRVRSKLSPNAKLPNCLVYSPVEEWTNDDVWMFLMQQENPWGFDNKELLTMYQGASPDGECPLVIDSTTRSCGDSRFGCWVCTLVEEDRSMTAMIQNDEEKEWMLPLLELRNELDKKDRHLRDFRRMSGRVQLFHDQPIPGPYLQEARERWLRMLLEAQKWVRETGPREVRDIELVSLNELQEIRRLWVVEKHEFEDNLPKIYESATGSQYPGEAVDDGLVFGAEELAILKDLCGDDRVHFELLRELLDVEHRYRTMSRRAGLFEALEQAFKRSFYASADDATERARRRNTALEEAQHRAFPEDYPQPGLFNGALEEFSP